MKTKLFILIPVILIIAFGIYCEIAFVNTVVILFGEVEQIPNLNTLIFAALAPLVYIFYYIFFYFVSVYLSKITLPDVIKNEVAATKNINNERFYKTLSDDALMVVEGLLFPIFLSFYRLFVILALSINFILIFFTNNLFLLLQLIIFISAIIFFLKKFMQSLANRFSILQNLRHEEIAVIHNSINDNNDLKKYNLQALVRIFPYKLIIASMGSLMKPVIDFLTIAFILSVVLGLFGDISSSFGLVAGLGATGWRLLGPAINILVAYGQINYAYSSLNISWKKAIKNFFFTS